MWAFLVATCACVVWWALDVRQRSEDMGRKVDELRRGLMQTLTTSWTSHGLTYTVTTVRRDNESLDDFNTRHDAAVDAALKLHPKD
mgnify:CR=1 FL=1